MKKVIITVLRIGISVVLLVYLFKQVDEKAVLKIIHGSDWALLAVSLSLFSLTYLLCFYRWYMLLQASGVKLSRLRVLASLAGGIFFNQVLPSTIGGDFVRTIDLGRHSKKPGQVVASVFLDRLSGYVGLVILTLFSLAYGWRLVQNKNIIISISVVTGILVLIVSVLFNEFLYRHLNGFFNNPLLGKIGQTFKAMHDRLHGFRGEKKIIVQNVIISIIIQAISPLTSYLVALALGIKINLAFFFIFMPVIGAITLLPISIGGLGLRENMTAIFFQTAGVGKDLAVAMSLINTAFLTLYGIIAGAFYFFSGHLLKKSAS